MIYLENAIDILNGFRRNLIDELNKHKDFEYIIPKRYSSVVMTNEKEFELYNYNPICCDDDNIDNCSLCFSFRIISRNSAFIISGYINKHNKNHYNANAMGEALTLYGNMTDISRIKQIVNEIVNYKALAFESYKNLPLVDWADINDK
jgi:hypothetical protein